MPSLQVREMPEALYQSLADLARREHRSLAQQTIAILSRELGREQSQKARRQDLLQDLRRHPIVRKGKLPNPANLLREDRER